MRSIPAFSKKPLSSPTVGGGGQRSGFTAKDKTTAAPKMKSVPHMAATYPTKSSLTKTSGGANPKGHPSFKSHSGSAGKSVAAFSKKAI